MQRTTWQFRLAHRNHFHMLATIGQLVDCRTFRRRQLYVEVEARRPDSDCCIPRRHLLARCADRLTNSLRQHLRMSGAIALRKRRRGDCLVRSPIRFPNPVIVQQKVRSVARKIGWHGLHLRLRSRQRCPAPLHQRIQQRFRGDPLAML